MLDLGNLWDFRIHLFFTVKLPVFYFPLVTSIDCDHAMRVFRQLTPHTARHPFPDATFITHSVPPLGSSNSRNLKVRGVEGILWFGLFWSVCYSTDCMSLALDIKTSVSLARRKGFRVQPKNFCLRLELLLRRGLHRDVALFFFWRGQRKTTRGAKLEKVLNVFRTIV